MDALPFVKMHGLGNDFVVVDARARGVAIDEARARAIADRRTGVGCDQLIVIEPARANGADAFMRIRNADGGEVESCGNASRCVARLLMGERGRAEAVIETLGGTVVARDSGHGLITVDMGAAREDWRDIPLARAADTLHLPVADDGLADPVGVNVGNPHAVFFVADAGAIDLAAVGPRLEHHPLFPERTNVEVAEVRAKDRIRLRVWERGAGITRACGTGACAALVAAARRGLTARAAEVELDGGPLRIEWRDDGHVLMTGPAAESFRGVIDPAVLA